MLHELYGNKCKNVLAHYNESQTFLPFHLEPFSATNVTLCQTV